MSLNTWLNDVFEAGPSSGPRYEELQGVWEAYLANDDARYVSSVNIGGGAEAPSRFLALPARESCQAVAGRRADACRIDDHGDDSSSPSDLWALPDDPESQEQLIASLPADLLDIIGGEDDVDGRAAGVHVDGAASVQHGSALSNGGGMSLHDRLKLYVHPFPDPLTPFLKMLMMFADNKAPPHLVRLFLPHRPHIHQTPRRRDPIRARRDPRL